MRILSIHTTYHDANYCILEDGKIIVHNELERFTRIKHDGSFNHGFKERLHGHFLEHKIYEIEFDYIVSDYFRDESVSDYLDLTKFKGKPIIEYVGHHTCHASSAFYNSNFDDAIIFSIDGGGYELLHPTKNNTMFIWEIVYNGIFQGLKNKITPITYNTLKLVNIGNVWHQVLEKILNMGTTFSKFGDESGTVMAMAPFGNQYKYLDEFRNLLGYSHENLNLNFLKSEVEKNEENKFHIAASLQRFTEDFIINFILMNLNLTNSKNVCFTGGVSLNCVALGKIAKILIDKGYNVFCDQAPNDSGLSLGGAKYHWYNNLNNTKSIELQNSYLGRTYSETEIKNYINERNNLEITENVNLDDIVSLLMGAKIISLFNEGSESGKRALGNRSIVADPRFSFMKNFINDKVKHRKSYRPFAPSILREEVSEWFDFNIDSPYMSFAIPVKENKRMLVPAILHEDNTARLQTVTKQENGFYYDLIKKFFSKTNVPMLLNTSFNNQEPIVESPINAIDCFLKTDIDYLYFVKEQILIKKKI